MAPRRPTVTSKLTEYLAVDPRTLTFKTLSEGGANEYATRRLISLKTPTLTPEGWVSGGWGRRKRFPRLCRTGWHCCGIGYVETWKRGSRSRVFIAQAEGDCDRSYDKTAWATARLLVEVRTDSHTLERLSEGLMERLAVLGGVGPGHVGYYFTSSWKVMAHICHQLNHKRYGYGNMSSEAIEEYERLLIKAWQIIITRAMELDAAEVARLEG